jgi:hypothetical protein
MDNWLDNIVDNVDSLHIKIDNLNRKFNSEQMILIFLVNKWSLDLYTCLHNVINYNCLPTFIFEMKVKISGLGIKVMHVALIVYLQIRCNTKKKLE